MTETDAARYRSKAEDCRRLAENALSPADKKLGCALPQIGSNSRRMRRNDASDFGPSAEAFCARYELWRFATTLQTRPQRIHEVDDVVRRALLC